jgi:hypothetical protein
MQLASALSRKKEAPVYPAAFAQNPLINHSRIYPINNNSAAKFCCTFDAGKFTKD